MALKHIQQYSDSLTIKEIQGKITSIFIFQMKNEERT